MRRMVVVLLCLGISLSIPAGAEAAGNRRQVTPRGRQKPNKGRATVKPLARPRRNGQSLVDSRRQVEPQVAEYDDGGYDDEGYDDEGYEPEQRPRPIALGRVQGLRTHYGPNGMTPRAPGYGQAFEPFVGGKAKQYGKVGAVVTTAAAVVIAAVAITFIGVPLIHNLPQILGGGP